MNSYYDILFNKFSLSFSISSVVHAVVSLNFRVDYVNYIKILLLNKTTIPIPRRPIQMLKGTPETVLSMVSATHFPSSSNSRPVSQVPQV